MPEGRRTTADVYENKVEQDKMAQIAVLEVFWKTGTDINRRDWCYTWNEDQSGKDFLVTIVTDMMVSEWKVAKDYEVNESVIINHFNAHC